MPMRDRLARLVQRNSERPSLRQRAAALKASAAKVMRRPMPAVVSAPIAEAAPAALPRDAGALALVDAIEREWAAWSAASARDYQARGAEVDARHEARGARRDALLYAAIDLPATSRAERHAKALAHAWIGVVEAWQFKRPREAYKFDELLAFDIDAALAPDGMAGDPNCPLEGDADAPTAPVAVAPSTGHDAELIELGRQFDAAHAAWMGLLPASTAAQRRVEAFRRRAQAEGLDEAAALRAAWLQDGVNEAHDAEQAAFDALEPLNRAIMALPAHTAGGLAVKAKAVIPTIWPAGDFDTGRALGDEEDWERRAVRDLIEACLLLARRHAAGGLPSDGMIQKAGEDFRDGSVLYETIDGKLLRGPVSEWIGYMAHRLYSVARKEASRQFNQQCADLDGAARDALWSELQRELRVDALGDLVFRSREVFEAAEAKRRAGEGAAAEPVASGLPDLSKLSIVQLRNLYDRYVQVSDLWNDALHAPWANDPAGAGMRGPNAAGDLIEAEQTRICSLYAAVVAEISKRTPSGEGLEANWQLETLIRHELMCNGDLREAPELRAAIAERWSA